HRRMQSASRHRSTDGARCRAIRGAHRRTVMRKQRCVIQSPHPTESTLMSRDSSPRWDALWRNAHLATMANASGYGEIRDGAIAVKDGRIAWLGMQNNLPATYVAKEEHDGQVYWLTPGLIDCHTHIIYAGNRSDEFEARLNGVTYEEIARRGGGILSTVRAT